MAIVNAPAVRQYGAALRTLAVFTVLLGLAYPLAMTAVAQLLAHANADGSLVHRGGRVVGSDLIGQSFTDAKGRPLAQYFQSRPSAAGDGYDGGASSGSNYGPENDDLIAAIDERQTAIADADHVPAGDIPADAVTASGSGLDPHISPAYALLQVERVAEARGLPVGDVRALVEHHIQGRDLGYIGEPRVDVLELNIALAGLGD